MNTKFNKIVKTVAVGVFFMALLMNVKVSLTDPFIRIDNAALAQSSSTPPSCNAPYTLHFRSENMGKWCGTYFTFWQTCVYAIDEMCPCSQVEEEDCV